MKRKVLIGALLWALVVTVSHVQLNVGWKELSSQIEEFLGKKRRELTVGFLPVT